MRRAAALTTSLAVFLASPAASATERSRVRLVVEHAPGMPACPDERATRDAIAERLGYDPIDPSAEALVAVRFSSSKEGIAATVRHQLEPEAQPLQRELHTGSRSCSEAARIVALTLALAIDPLAATSFSPSAPAPAREAQRPDTSTAGPPPHEAPPPSDWSWTVGAGGAILVGALPNRAPVAELLADVDGRRFALEITLEGSLPGEARDPSGRGVRASLLGGSAAGCVLLGAARVCPGVFVGALLGEGVGLEAHTTDTTALVSARLRAAFDLRLGARVAVRPFGEIGAPLTRTTLGFGDVDVWTTPALSGAFGGAVVLRP